MVFLREPAPGPGLLEIGSRSTEDVPLLISEDVLIAEDVPLAQKAEETEYSSWVQPVQRTSPEPASLMANPLSKPEPLLLSGPFACLGLSGTPEPNPYMNIGLVRSVRIACF